MFEDDQGPVERFEWGRFTVGGDVHGEGHLGVGKDIRLVGDQVTEWAERKGHLLTPEMITGVYGLDLEVLIVGNGVDSALVCPESVTEDVHRHGIPELRVRATPQACAEYNELFRDGRRVALLAHGTC